MRSAAAGASAPSCPSASSPAAYDPFSQSPHLKIPPYSIILSPLCALNIAERLYLQCHISPSQSFLFLLFSLLRSIWPDIGKALPARRRHNVHYVVRTPGTGLQEISSTEMRDVRKGKRRQAKAGKRERRFPASFCCPILYLGEHIFGISHDPLYKKGFIW